jgi:protein TonB
MGIAMHWSLYQRRETAAQAGTITIGILLLVLSQTLVMQQDLPKADEPISLTIEAPAVAPEKIVEQVIQTPPPEKIVEMPKEIVPVTDAPAPAIQETVQPPKPPEPQVQPKGNPDAERQYVSDLKAQIDRKKVYPEAARDMGMTGEVEVEYELDRLGNLVRAEIVSSSGYKLLDQAALKTAKSLLPKGFPDGAWLGANSRVFRTKVGFFN